MRSKLFVCLAMSLCILVSSHAQKKDISITASSTLSPSSTSNFSPENVMDGGTASWSEGKSGPGIGEYIQVDFRYPDLLEYVMVKNGYGEEKYWEANSRIKKLKISNEDGESRTIELEDTPDMKIYGLYQTFEEDGLTLMEKPLYGSDFKFELLEIYPGTRWDDACLTEIGMNTWYYEQFDISEEYIFENLYREFLEAYACVDGKMYVESEWDGHEELSIIDGYYYKEITSGDGTQGYTECQIFVHGWTDEYYILISDYISEIDMEPRENMEAEAFHPSRIESYRWDFLQYDKEDQAFFSIKEDAIIDLFDVYLIEELMKISGASLLAENIWIAPSEPGFIKVVFTGSGEDPKPELNYYWDGNFFRLQE